MSAITFQSRDGLKLVGEWERPDSLDAVLVICHAHPKMGGTMESPLLVALKDTMVERNYAVLRFNFRGIEGSEGTAGTGEAEIADAHGAIDHATEIFPGLPIAVAGWSFGGAVAVKAVAERDDVSACVAIAPAVKPKPGVTAGLPPDLTIGVPLLVVVGSNDDLTLPKDCKSWAEAAGADYQEVPAANHFFWAKYDPLMERIAAFYEEVV